MRYSLALLTSLSMMCAAADWPQWRGPNRDGVAPDSPPLIEKIPEAGLPVLWESEPVPANEDGGLSTPVVAGGKVFIALVWHREEPTETRQVDDRALLQLGFQSTKGLPADLLKKVEDTRSQLPPNLRGKKLDQFADQFAKENFDSKQQQLYSAWLKKRFQKGKFAIPLTTLDALDQNKDRVFSNEAEMKKWLNDQGWADFVVEQVAKSVSPTRRVADDAVICLDAATGKTLWKTTRPGKVVGFDGSSTPCIADGHIYALGSERLWCLNTNDGTLVWEAPLGGARQGLGSSPLLVDGTVVVNIGKVSAFDAATGKPRWTQDKAGGLHASAVAWTGDGKTLVLINGKNLSALDPSTGAIAWSVPAGGDSTPTVHGDVVFTQSFTAELGLVAYKVSATKADKLWNLPYSSDVLRTQSSPVVVGKQVYLFDDNNHYCVDAETGKKVWSTKSQSTISSPAVADGKLFALTNNGNTLLMLATGTNEAKELGRATVRAQWVPSPCIADGRIILRMGDRVKAWNLTR